MVLFDFVMVARQLTWIRLVRPVRPVMLQLLLIALAHMDCVMCCRVVLLLVTNVLAH